MKKALLFGLVQIFSLSILLAQTTVKGKVADSETAESVIGANILVIGTSNGTVTDVNGNFELKVEGEGSKTIEISFVGYEAVKQTIDLNGSTIDLGTIALSASTMLDEIEVIASIAIDRKTPVAVATLKADVIEEKLGNQEFPEILRSTPSIYVTKQGGGFGDSRINVRGFDQRNTAVMINGVPVNDMENGWVYWSNWAGLSDVTSQMQVQRGLGASKLAISSVGGTINIITNAAEMKKGGKATTTVGNDGYQKYGLMLSSGLTEKGWAATFQATHTRGDGYVDGTMFRSWSYFGSVSKVFNKKHTVALTAIGAPQWHHQRDWANPISEYDEFGKKYNSDWGWKDGEEYTWRKNFYHKPKIFMNHYWTISDKTDVSTSVYYSIGRGGGTGPRGSIGRIREYSSVHENENGVIEFDPIVAWNQGQTVSQFGDNATRTTYEGGGEGGDAFIGKYVNTSRDGFIRRASMNSHNWVGILSNLTHEVNDNLTISAGIDARNYRGLHYRRLDDLLGADAYLSGRDKNYPDGRILTEEKSDDIKLNYNNDGLVRWLGLFGQLEWSNDKVSVFTQFSGSNQAFKRIDYFTYLDSDPARETDWQNFLGGNVKFGLNYNINDFHNVFMNTGYYSRQPIFDNVFQNFVNDINESAENERIFGLEAGYGLRTQKFSANVNLYRTTWTNRQISRSETFDIGVDPVTGDAIQERGTINLAGIVQVHQGIEVDFVAKPVKGLSFDGMISLGNWSYGSDVAVDVFGDSQNKIATVDMYLDGVRVGDAAQTTMRIGATYEVKGFRVFSSYYYADELYADYNLAEESVFDTPGNQALKLPSYSLVDLGASYKLKLKGKSSLTFNFNINNLLDEEYISESETNYIDADRYDRNRVFYGFGRTWNMGMSFKF